MKKTLGGLSAIAQKMIRTIIGIALIASVAAFLYYRSRAVLPFLTGVLLGSLTSILKVILLERAVDKAMTMEKKQAGNYVSLQHILRLFVSGLVLFLGAVVPAISLWGVVTGILAYQIGVYSSRSVR